MGEPPGAPTLLQSLPSTKQRRGCGVGGGELGLAPSVLDYVLG